VKSLVDVWYFAYGANVDKQTMKQRVGAWKDALRASLRGYSLRFRVYSTSWGGGVADIMEDSEGTVHGVVYLLEAEQMKMLDRYEGVPNLYLHAKVRVETAAGPKEAVTYVASQPKQFIAPSGEYLATVIRGLRQHGYDESVVSSVKKAARAGKV